MNYDMRLLVGDVAAVVKHLKGDKAIIVGHRVGYLPTRQGQDASADGSRFERYRALGRSTASGSDLVSSQHFSGYE